MKKLFGLLALVLGVVSCQNDFDGANVGGDEVAVTLNVAVPDDATRAAGSDSALSGLQNIDLNRYDIRYILEVYDAKDNLAKPRIVKCEDESASTSFDLRLVPGRDYRFVVWADFVLQGTNQDLHYNTTDIKAISLNGEQKANDESRDAYTCVHPVENFKSGAPIKIELKRPFAKLRVVTTDMNHLYSDLTSVTVAYTTPLYTTFNALTGEKDGLQSVASTTKVVYLTDDFKYTNESDYKTNGKMTLFADYFFGAKDDAIHFELDAEDATGMDIPEVFFNTNIPVQRNYLTTVMGPVLTDAANVTVKIEDAFENEENPNDPPYYQVAVSNGFELVKALYEGREIIVLNNITVTAADVEAYLATTRTGNAINPVLNLNGFTITIDNNNTEALVNLNGGALTVEGEGAIKSTEGALVETIYNAGEATIEENAAESVVNCLSEIRAAFANGGVYTMVCDFAISESLTLATGKELVFDLNGKTLTGYDKGTASYGLIVNKGTLTVKNGTITLKAENNRGWNAYSSVISNTVGGNLVVEDVTIEHLGGTDMAYGIDNLTNGKGTYAETTVNNGAVVKSPYRAIRQFLNGIEAQNILTVNAGAVVEGTNKSIWMQDPNANANTGKLVVNEGATLNGDVYLFVCAGSTEWPVEVSIAASAVNGEVLTGNVPAGYAVKNVNGAWKVLKYTVVNTPAAILSEVAKDNAVVYIENGDYKLDGKLSFGKNVTIFGNGASLFNDWGSLAFNKQCTFNNVAVFDVNFTNNTILDMAYAEGEVYFENCVFTHVRGDQSIHFDGKESAKVTFKNCTMYGRNMLASSLELVKFDTCKILESTWNTEQGNKGTATGWSGVNMWGKCEFVNTQFDAACHCSCKTAGVVATFTGCTYTNGEAITEAIIKGTEANIAGSTITIK